MRIRVLKNPSTSTFTNSTPVTNNRKLVQQFESLIRANLVPIGFATIVGIYKLVTLKCDCCDFGASLKRFCPALPMWTKLMASIPFAYGVDARE